ncbi:MAG TPA: hypothetical protein VD995_14825 [Azospirillum sp.]|nr:hypothetical protein [Azospirillum sp.]
MSRTTNADGKSGGGASGGGDVVGRLSQMSNRTNLMVIDATFRALPKGNADGETGYLEAAAEVRALARRMRQAALDFQATVMAPEAAE